MSKDIPKGSPILCLDFDGVLHSYASGWKGPRDIPDAPVDGAIDWLKSLVADQRDPFAPRHLDFDVQIYSSRSRYFGGRSAMKAWLRKWGMRPGEIEAIEFPTKKPPAFLQIDDRALTFNGTFPTVQKMQAFTPWNKPNKGPLGATGEYPRGMLHGSDEGELRFGITSGVLTDVTITRTGR